MTEIGDVVRRGCETFGQQKGSKRAKSSLCDRVKISVLEPQTRMEER